MIDYMLPGITFIGMGSRLGDKVVLLEVDEDDDRVVYSITVDGRCSEESESIYEWNEWLEDTVLSALPDWRLASLKMRPKCRLPDYL